MEFSKTTDTLENKKIIHIPKKLKNFPTIPNYLFAASSLPRRNGWCIKLHEIRKKKRIRMNSRSEFVNSFEIYTPARARHLRSITLAPYFYIYITFILLGSRWRTLIHKLYSRRTVQPTHPSLSITEHRIVLAWPLDTSRIGVESRCTMTFFPFLPGTTYHRTISRHRDSVI